MLHTRLFFFLFLRIFKIVIVSIGSFYLSNSCHATFCASQWHSWSTRIPIEKYFIRLTFLKCKGVKLYNCEIVKIVFEHSCTDNTGYKTEPQKWQIHANSEVQVKTFYYKFRLYTSNLYEICLHCHLLGFSWFRMN